MESEFSFNGRPGYTLPALSEPREIRLLKASVTSSEGHKHKLSLSIACFSIDNCPPFTALSYTWGDPMVRDAEHGGIGHPFEPGGPNSDDTVGDLSLAWAPVPVPNGIPDIQPTGQRYPMSRNVVVAIVHLCLAGFNGGWFWIDSVCIDQQNHDEKETQVALMDEIYSRADSVVVWLGPDTTDLKEFAWLHDDFLVAISEYIKARGLDYVKQQHLYSPEFMSELNISKDPSEWATIWNKYLAFYRRRRWFSRSWVVQEVALARNVIVQCGTLALHWETMCQLSKIFQLLGWQHSICFAHKEICQGGMGQEILHVSYIKENLDNELRHLKDDDASGISNDQRRRRWFLYFQLLIYDMRGFLATDPRDKIFSILGIAKRALPPGMKMPFRPDYSDTSAPRSAFTALTTTMLKELPRLQTLCHVEDRSATKIAGLPSWVPDYTSQRALMPFEMLRGDSHKFDCWPLDGGRIDDHNFRVCGDSLFIRGAEFDRVVAVGTRLSKTVCFEDLISWLALCEDLNPEYFAKHNGPGEVFWRTIIADTYEYNPASASLGEGFKIWFTSGFTASLLALGSIPRLSATGLAYFNSLPGILALFSRIRAADKDLADSCIPSTAELIKLRRSLFGWAQSQRSNPRDLEAEYKLMSDEAMRRATGDSSGYGNIAASVPAYRRLFRTERGYLGLGPASVLVGDQVWGFQGAMVPFILRAREGHSFSLVGETYLHGFMDGEMKQRVGSNVTEIRIL